jgi:8-oxo-dGTP diphosphatase
MGYLNTSLCYIEQDGRYLMLHRVKKKQDPNAGKWIGVGGKFEDGESPEECAVREVLEETGLTMVSPRLRGIVTFVTDAWPTEYMFLFTADQFSGELRSCDEGELAWVEKERVLSLPLWEGDRVFLPLLAEEHPFFSLKLSYHGEALVSAVLDGKILSIN